MEYAQIIPKSSNILQPWKNGRGQTAQIAIEKTDSTREEELFLWRLSTAPITQDGPFSEFPGCERLLYLVDGQELSLHFPLEQKTLRVLPGQVASFSGESQVIAKIPNGAVTDLGLIYSRQSVTARMNEIKVKKLPKSFVLNSPSAILYLAAGSLTITTYPGEHRYSISPGDCVRFKNLPKSASNQERLVMLETKSSDSRVVAIEMSSL
jgi:uncharacterized protein